MTRTPGVAPAAGSDSDGWPLSAPETSAPPRTLDALCRAAHLEVPADAETVRITGLAYDSRRVCPGNLYLAMPGASTHGARHAPQAVEAGAAAIVTDGAGVDELPGQGLMVPVVVVDDARRAMAAVSAAFHQDPAARVPTFAVTGTNGKTTTTFLVEALLAHLGRRVGLIGTIGFRLDGEPLEWHSSTVTTPEAPDLQHLFAEMIERGAEAIAMEVSSHALSLSRAAGTTFTVAGFTMLGRDHLDFHHTIDDYFEAKASLFTGDPLTGAGCQRAAVWVDDPWGHRLAERITDRPLTTVGTGARADVRLLRAEPSDDGTGQYLVIDLRGQRIETPLALPGAHNAANAALALAMIDAAGLDAVSAAGGLAGAAVPGRMQRVDLADDQAPRVVVDFAHTPQAVSETVQAVTPSGRRIVVLGAGGDRDAAKRPLMGRAAGEHAGLVVVTDDNPRTEDPALIREAVAQGAREIEGVEVVEVADRRGAIAVALEQATAHDVVLVLGKGHERGQQLDGAVVDFDDVAVVTEEWAALHQRRGLEEGADGTA